MSMIVAYLPHVFLEVQFVMKVNPKSCYDSKIVSLIRCSFSLQQFCDALPGILANPRGWPPVLLPSSWRRWRVEQGPSGLGLIGARRIVINLLGGRRPHSPLPTSLYQPRCARCATGSDSGHVSLSPDCRVAE